MTAIFNLNVALNISTKLLPTSLSGEKNPYIFRKYFQYRAAMLKVREFLAPAATKPV
jgi:hypothetical protein